MITQTENRFIPVGALVGLFCAYVGILGLFLSIALALGRIATAIEKPAGWSGGPPMQVSCPEIPACPAPIIRLGAPAVVVTRCDPLESLRAMPNGPDTHPGVFPAPLGAE